MMVQSIPCYLEIIKNLIQKNERPTTIYTINKKNWDKTAKQNKHQKSEVGLC